jgi:hypothetical protein
MKKIKLKKNLNDNGKTIVFINCPFCFEKISGISKNHLISNLKIHGLIKHKGEKETEIEGN